MSFGQESCIACDEKHPGLIARLRVKAASATPGRLRTCVPMLKNYRRKDGGLGFSRPNIFEMLKDLAKNSTTSTRACRLSRRPQSLRSQFRVADDTARMVIVRIDPQWQFVSCTMGTDSWQS